MPTDLSAKASLNTQGFSEGVQQIRDKLNQLNTALAQNAQEIKKTNAEINSLVKEQKTLAAEMKDGGTDEQKKKMQELSDKVAQATAKLGQLKTTQQELKGTLRETSKELVDVGKNAGDAGAEMQNAFQTAASALAAAGITKALKELYDAFADCVSVAMEFKSSISTVEALSGANEQEVAALTAQAKELGATTKFTANEAAQAMTYMGMAGWDAQQMMQGMDGVLSLAAASGEDLAQVSDIVTDSLTAFGLAADDAAHFADVLAAAATNSNTTVAGLGETFKYCAPIAGTLGYSIEDVATAVGLMANAGIKSSMAGTALRSTFQGLVSGATLTSEAFGKIEVSAVNADGTMKTFGETVNELRGYFSQMTEAEKMFNANELAGTRGGTGLLAILNATDEEYDKLKGKIESCSGAAKEMSEIKMDNLSGDVALMNSAFDALKTTIGESFEPELKDLTKTITDVISGTNDFAVNNEELTKSIIAAGGAFAALIGAVTVISAVQKAMALLNGTMLANPFVLVAAAVAALVVGLGSLIGSIKSTEEELEDARQAAKSFTDEMNNTADKSAGLKEINERYAEINSTMSDGAEKTAALEEIQRTLNEKYGEAAENIDVVNGSYEAQSQKIQKLIGDLDDYARAQANLAYEELKKAEVAERDIKIDYIVDRSNDPETFGKYKDIIDGMTEEAKKGIEVIQDYDGLISLKFVGSAEEKQAALKEFADKMKETGLIDVDTKQWSELVLLEKEYAEVVAENAIVTENYNKANDKNAEILGDVKDKTDELAESQDNLSKKTRKSAEEIDKSFEQCSKGVNDLVKSTKDLSSAFAEQNENGELSADTILSLVDAGYAAALAVDAETGAVRLDAEAYRELAKAKIEAQKVDIKSAQWDLKENYYSQIADKAKTGALTEAKALKKKLEEELKDSCIELGVLDAAENNIDKVISGTYGSKKSDTGKKKTDEETPEEKALKEFRKAREDLKYEHDLGKKEKEAYYKDLEDLYNEYVGKVEDGAANSEMRSVYKDIKTYKDNKPEEEYKKEKADLDYKHSMDEITEAEYYDNLAKLRDKYLKEGTEAWKAATLAIHKYEEKLVSDKEKVATNALKSEVKKRIEAVDEELKAKKKASEEAIKAIDDEIEARRRLKEDNDIQSEINAVIAQMNYGQNDEFSMRQLERKLQSLENQQAETAWERNAADRKAEISAQADADSEDAQAKKDAINDAADSVENALEKASNGIALAADEIEKAAAALGVIFSGTPAGTANQVTNNNDYRSFAPNINFASQSFTPEQFIAAFMEYLQTGPIS